MNDIDRYYLTRSGTLGGHLDEFSGSFGKETKNKSHDIKMENGWPSQHVFLY